ncbi:MAG: PepSY domain-containing protein [Leptolyngbyaceae cyanobacterium]
MALNKARVRALHRWFAPVMAIPLLLTLTTGMGFQMAATAGRGSDFIWLLQLHKGKWGPLDLSMVYPFLNGLGLLTLMITGILMWWQTKRRKRSPSA